MGSCSSSCCNRNEDTSSFKLHYVGRERVDLEREHRYSNEEIRENSVSSLFIGDSDPSLHSLTHLQTNSAWKLFRRKLSVEKHLLTFPDAAGINPGTVKEIRLELLDDVWSTSEMQFTAPTENIPSSSRNTAIRSKAFKSIHSTPGNSLDLEWEHLPEMVVFTQMNDKDEVQASATTASAWSRLSSPDSLEWDPVESNLNNPLDHDTEELLEEIEKLSSTVLRETQEWNS